MGAVNLRDKLSESLAGNYSRSCNTKNKKGEKYYGRQMVDNRLSTD